MKKTVGVLSLIVMLLSQVFSPFAYAVSGEEVPIPEPVVEEIVPETDVAEPEVVEKGSSDETKYPENPVEEENIIVNQEQMSGDNLSGTNTEILSGGTIQEETTEENLEGKEDTDVIIENKMVVEAIVKGFGGEVEYNSEEVRGTKEHKNVKVEVYAETGAFEETPTLVIEPLESEKETEIKKVILDYNEDTENLAEEEIEQVAEEKITEVVAFDIKFLDKEEKEVQPREGMVKVEFNYTENETLQETEEHEVKVYHLDDKDNAGDPIEEIKNMKIDEPEVTEEIKVENEELDEQKVEEGTGEQKLTVVGDKFSIYTIVQQVKEEGPQAITEDQLANFVYGEISIARPDGLIDDGPAGFTIMDRNLGAITTGAYKGVSSISYGYHYQWGNNYGFDLSWTKETNPNNFTGNKISIAEGTTEYSGNKFVGGPSSQYVSWMNDNRPTLWGGNSDSVIDKQGPCPEGWHVPTILEWSQLLVYYAYYFDPSIKLSGAMNKFFSSNTGLAMGFANKFNLPFAGSRDYRDGTVGSTGSNGYYRSSSPTNNNMIYYIGLGPDFVYTTNVGYNFAMGHSVRCFKNSYTPHNEEIVHTITYEYNGGSGSTAAINVISGEYVIEPEEPIKEGYDFLGWYKKNGDEYAAEPFDFTGTVIAGDIELYAKWGNPAVGGYSWHDSCFEYESLGVDENGKYSVRLIGYDSESCGLQDLVIPGLVSKNGKDYYVKKIGELLFSHTGLQGTLVIGDGVEEIERWSFGYNDIEKVIFPDSLKIVGYSAFYGNAKLETIDFGQGVESLGYSSFKDCGLKSLSFPSSLKIIGTRLDDQNGVFQNNTGLQTVEFSEGIEVIGGYSFENTKIESISFPNSLTGIGTFAFANNPILNEVILNEGLQYIGGNAFSSNPSLTSFVIPSTVEYFGSNIFGIYNTMTPITYLEINAKNAHLGYGIFEYLPVKKLIYNGSGNIPNSTFSTLYDLTELIIGDDVTSIGSNVFDNAPITGLTIPGNVKSIGSYAFYNSALKKLEIENGVLSIGYGAFGIDEIESVFVPDSVTYLDGSVFRGGGIIHRLVVGDGVVSMGNCSFGNVEILELGDGITELGPWNTCSMDANVLKKIILGNGITSITPGTFSAFKSLEEIEIGNSLIMIQTGTFSGTPNLKKLTLGSSVTLIGSGEFIGAQFSGVQLPLSLATLGNGVFCSDSVKEPGSIVGMITGATAAQIESLEAQDNTECLVLKKDKYTLTYNAGAHSGLVDNQPTLGVVVDYNGTIQLTGNGAKTATSQKGYTFLGWTTELNGTVPLAANTYTITGDVTLYPVFKKYSITKRIKFYKNGNEGYTYNGNDYTEDQEFILCTIQERYNADEDVTTCSEEIEFPMGISENTPVTKGWTRNSEGDGIVYTGGEQIEVTSEDSTISYYLQMYAPEKVFKANYEYGSGVEELTITSGSCMIAETINGNIQSESCEVALPELNALTGYHTPLWYKKGEDITYSGATITLTGDIILEAKAIANTYTVVYKPGEGTGEMESQEFEYDKEESLNKNKYRKEGYHFSGWIDMLGKEYRDGEKVLNLLTEGVLELTAQWLQNPPAAGGGQSITPATKEQEHNAAEEKPEDKQESNQDKQQDETVKDESKTPENTNTSNQTNTQQSSSTSPDNSYKTVVDPEIQSAYEWAYERDVTTIPSLDDAMPDGVVKRGHLAKMVVNYATNVLGREIPEKIPSECRWNDWRKDWESEEIKDYAVKSCALGLMGLDMPKFLPNMEVTRAQFGTIMSRLLWGKKYAGGTPYYRKHLNALKENNIMIQIGNPEKRVELRQWVWLMLMRSAENK